MTAPDTTPPPAYRGVWARRLLTAPGLHDDRTIVHWLQAGRWHADLRVPGAPAGAPPLTPDERLLAQQGFTGLTTVERVAGREVCTWHRQHDLQPPRGVPDTGYVDFESDDRLIETGVLRPYHEVWERLPGSSWRALALESHAADGRLQRLLVAGDFAMLVRPRRGDWPAGTADDDDLARVLARHPALREPLLDFEISFGRIDGETWTIAHSSLPWREGVRSPLRIGTPVAASVRVLGPDGEQAWSVMT